MATTSKISSPKKGKKLKKYLFTKRSDFAPKKPNSPRKNVRRINHKVDDIPTAWLVAKKAKGSRQIAKQLQRKTPSPMSASPLSKRPKLFSPSRATGATASKESPKSKQSPQPRQCDTVSPVPVALAELPKNKKCLKLRLQDTIPPVPAKSKSPIPEDDEEVPSYEFCAKYGFTGKEAEVARTLIKTQTGFASLHVCSLSNTKYTSPEFKKAFRSVAGIGFTVAGGNFGLFHRLSTGIFELMEMRLKHYGISPDLLLDKFGGFDLQTLARKADQAGSCHSPVEGKVALLPKSGLLGQLLALIITLYEQIKMVKEFDRVDGVNGVADVTMEEAT